MRKFTSSLSKCRSSSRYSRLASDLDSYEPQLELRILRAKDKDDAWASRAKELVKTARKDLEECKIDEGWKALNTAKRLEVYGMNEAERLAVAHALLRELTKLNEWRRDAILSLFGNGTGQIKDPPSAEALIMALELRDEHNNNLYYKTKLTWRLIRFLFVLLIADIVGICCYFTFADLGNDSGTGPGLSIYLIGVLLFGFLGAITSAILFTRNVSKSSRITELGSSREVTVSKIFIGAAFSVFIFLILKSSIADKIEIFSFSIDDPLDYFVVAFVSGFSERIAQKAIEAVAGKDKENEKGAATAEK